MASILSTGLTPESLGSEIITITVGKARAKKDFTIHKNLLCTHSDYFSKAFNGCFKEGRESKMNLSDESPEVFSVFIDYLYRGCIVSNSPPSPYSDTEIDTREEYYHKMQDAYILGEKFCMNDFMNIVMDNLRENVGFWDIEKRMASACTVYENTREGSPLRKFVSCDAAWRLMRACTQSKVEVILATAKEVPDFAADILWAQSKYGTVLRNSRRDGTIPFSRWKILVRDCDFHVKEKRKRCCDVKREVKRVKVELI